MKNDNVTELVHCYLPSNTLGNIKNTKIRLKSFYKYNKKKRMKFELELKRKKKWKNKK